MANYEEALDSFIKKMKYIENEQVLGIVFYGSYLTGYNSFNSDLDVHIIMNDLNKVLIRGVIIEQGYRIEYFEKPVSDLYQSVENDFLSQNNALVPIIAYGKILFERFETISKLQKYIINYFSQPLPPLSIDDAKELAVIIDNRIKALEKMIDLSHFNHNYHLVIEKIRKFYSKLSGCPDIPVAKAVRIYSDENYRNSFHKSNVPDQEFIDLYFKAIYHQGSNVCKLSIITELYNYSIKNLEINPNCYRFVIKSRNDPLNRIHE